MQRSLNYFRSLAVELFTTHSPSGYTAEVIAVLGKHLTSLGYPYTVTRKGNLVVTVEGTDASQTRATSAHVDTLGLMVRSIHSDGTLALTNVGGPIIATLDGEYCSVRTRNGKTYTGTILSNAPAAHVYPDATTKKRDIDSILVRLDEKVVKKEQVQALGIDHGDYVFIDPKFTLTPSGFLKSRFIDDKGSACLLMAVLEEIQTQKIPLKHRTQFIFVVHEEVGHGASTLDPQVSEFVTVDMGCVGLDLAGNEYAVSIAAKDSGGPYDYELTSRLIALAQQEKIPYAVDIFPFYGSDIGAAWRAGRDFKGALIGPGVHASHGLERTHLEAIDATMSLLLAYLTK